MTPTRKPGGKKPPPKKKPEEPWLSHACNDGKHHECSGKIGFISGKCECCCHHEKERKETDQC